MTESGSIESILDRRQLRRKVTFWRLTAIGVVIVALIAFIGRYSSATAHLTPHIARIQISGIITGNKDTIKLIKRVGASSEARAVLVDINSPGGTVTGAEHIYDELRRVAAKKPVVAVVGSLGASGGYIVALGANRIFADDNALVGSIGVLFEFPNISKLLDTIGVKVETIKSSPLKAAPNGFEPTSPAARAAINSLVVDSYGWFKGLVQKRRHMTDAQLAAVDDGRIFTGRQALKLKLVDQLGRERAAVAWLEAKKGVPKGLPIRDWKKKSATGRFGIFSMASAAADALGLPRAATFLSHVEKARDATALDGLLAIWHAGA